ncbi:amino acid transporter [Frondihabitans sp. PAMC 28766]|uniref:LysE/ArgO family amino acid transporter n=1 Tax=Frondihabitans sp. PAMC 28766 TaxID=1795630 RepID=UPI00078CB5CC|nr:LysE/ArgO family amino acid transporter [Frondihabitans sp. PAMC 28766]AMM19768.1 amino acid transporter [Frondihabitans sp. PAMC 28766]
MPAPLLAALLGLVTGLSLIIAIGAQNAFVLRLGIGGVTRLIAPVIVICALSDAALIAAGVAGIGALVQAAPVTLVIIRVVGSAFLIVYGLLAAKRALRLGALVADPDTIAVTSSTTATAATGPGVDGAGSDGAGSDAPRLRTVILTALAFTWLNPHVYLDTLLLLGSVANRQGHERWWFAVGALIASCLWFAALGFGARLLRPVFARPAAWRVLDAIIACVMIALGIRLAVGPELPYTR